MPTKLGNLIVLAMNSSPRSEESKSLSLFRAISGGWGGREAPGQGNFAEAHPGDPPIRDYRVVRKQRCNPPSQASLCRSSGTGRATKRSDEHDRNDDDGTAHDGHPRHGNGKFGDAGFGRHDGPEHGDGAALHDEGREV